MHGGQPSSSFRLVRDRGLLLVLLASSLVFLTSLYLPWETTPGVPVAPTGWNSSFGQAAGLIALALAATTASALVRPSLQERLPLARCALALGYFGLLVWAELRALGMFEQSNLANESVNYGSGAYLGVASALVAVLVAQLMRRGEVARRLSVVSVAGTVLTLGLLAAFILPLLRVHVPLNGSPTAFVFAAVSPERDTATIFAAGIVLFGAPVWADTRRVRERLAVAAATAILTGGTLSLVAHWTSYSWLALGCSLGLVALAVAESRGLPLVVRSWTELTAAAGAVLLIAALFLPWQHGYSGSGWTFSFSALAGGLAVVLVTLLLVASGTLAAELALGSAILVLAAGFTLTGYSSVAYGAILGFAGAAGMLVNVGGALRPVPADRRLLRLTAVAACVAFVAIAVVPLTGRLSAHLELEAPWRLLWLQIAAVLVAFRLLGWWLAAGCRDHRLVTLPLALLALTALDLVYNRGDGLSWGGVATVGLCLLLAAFGWIERYPARTDGNASTTSLATSP
jgi:hypothetical protein